MRNSEATRKILIQESANLFNTQGYKATSISDITRATGYTKGAIYRHFENKEDLERQALASLSDLMFDRLGTLVRDAPTFQKKFDAVFSFFENYMNAPLYEGGCPLLNAAVETDDSDQVLREQACKMLQKLKQSLIKMFENGIKNKQVHPDIDIQYYTNLFISALEGAVMISKLEKDPSAIKHAVTHLRTQVDQISL